MQLNKKPHLVERRRVKDEPMSYECSRCGQVFLFPEDRCPKDGAAELLAAFHKHVGEVHAEKADD
jgi:uncharacterized OB-fold protein